MRQLTLHPLRHVLAATLLLQLLLAPPVLANTAADRFQPLRGLNFEIWNEWLTTEEMVTRPGFLDRYPDWRRIVQSGMIAQVKAQGFDFVRLPFDPAPLLRLGPGAAQDGLIDQIVQAAGQMHDAGLKVIVDLHAFPRPGEDWGTDDIVGDPRLFDAHVALVGRVAARLDGLDPDRTALELLNEPTGDCDAIWQKTGTMLWPDQLQRLHAAARQGAPDLPLVVSGACWGGMAGLEQIDPARLGDDNLIYSFHSYDPFLFSHQSASWTDGPVRFFADVPYPPDQIDDALAAALAAEARARAEGDGSTLAATEFETAMSDYRGVGLAAVAAEVQRAATWADRNGIPRRRMLLGEFGAIREDMSGARLPLSDRAEFLSDKRRAAEELGIGWAVWDWTGSFGIVEDDTARTIAPALCDGLGLTGCQP